MIYTWLTDKNNVTYMNEDMMSFEETQKRC